MRILSHGEVAVMAGSPLRDRDGYPGPTRQELGTLAKFVPETKPPRIVDRPTSLRHRIVARVGSRLRGRSREYYPGPTRQELGILADRVIEAEASMTNHIPAPHLVAPTPTPPNDSLWEVDLTGPREVHVPACEVWQERVPDSPSTDSFLRQLDEVQAALRKRVVDSPWGEP
jgi:hypothetical protein